MAELTLKFGVPVSVSEREKNLKSFGKAIFDATATLPVAIFFSVAGASENARWALASHGGFEPSGSVKSFLDKGIPAGKIAVYAAFGDEKNGLSGFDRVGWNKEIQTVSDLNQDSFGQIVITRGPDIQGRSISGLYKWEREQTHTLLYQWADVSETERELYFDGAPCPTSGRCILGKLLILDWMRKNNVITMFRGHQHGTFLTRVNKCVKMKKRSALARVWRTSCARVWAHTTRANTQHSPVHALTIPPTAPSPCPAATMASSTTGPVRAS